MNVDDFPIVNDNRVFLQSMLGLLSRNQNGEYIGYFGGAVKPPGLQGTNTVLGQPELDGRMLRTTWVSFLNGTLILIGGARGFFNTQVFVNESNIFFSNPDPQSWTPLITDMAQWTYNAPGLAGLTLNYSNVFIVGYSMGGCVAYKLGKLLGAAGANVRKIWTFGSPRPGGEIAQFQCLTMNIRRYYNIDDPVRALPPHYSEAWSIWPLINQFTRTKWNAQCQVATGVCIDGGGVLREDEDLSPINGGETILNVGRYFLGLGTDIISPHLLSVYSDRIAKLTDASPVNPVGPNRPRAEPPATPTPAQTEQIVDQGVVLQEVAAMTPTVARTIVVTAPAGVKSEPYRPRHRDGIWTVERYGEVVDVGPGKRRAKSKSKRFNRASS